MGTTTNGYPYPEDTDPVAQGAQAIKSLATLTDTNLRISAAGTVSVNTAGVATAVASVVFPAGRFKNTPQVVTSTASTQWLSCPTGASTAGFTFNVRMYKDTNGAGALACYWSAMQGA